MKAMQPTLFIVGLIYILPIYCFLSNKGTDLVMEKKKMLEKCRDYKESLLVKKGKTDPNKMSSHYDSCDCGLESNERIPFSYRIVSTEFVQPLHKYPWQVQVRIGPQLAGAGVIINPNYVLTGGHVAKQIVQAAAYKEDNEINIKDASVAVATQTGNKQFVIFRIHQIKIHPSYGNSGGRPIYDIALLKLKDTIIFSKRVRPICLTMNKNLEKSGLNATVIGWGQMETGGNTTRRLKKGRVPIVDTEYCKKQLHKNRKAIGDHTICAGGSLFQDACEGDSGGPLQIQDECARWNLIGLTSWGEICAENDKPGVYTRVSYFLQWILRNTLDSLSCDSANAQRIEPNIKECGIPAYRYMKTGIPVRILTNPWVVNLYLGNKFLGNGVLINSTVVLTTTSVVDPWGHSLKSGDFTAHFGYPAFQQNSSDYLYDFAYVKDIIFHPLADHRFDLCLLVLGVPMADSLMKFHPICLTNMKIPFEVGDSVDISSYTGALMRRFKTATGRLLKFSKCRKLGRSVFHSNRSRCVVQTSKNFLTERFDSQWKESCQEERGAVISRNIEGRTYFLGMTSVAPDTCGSPRLFHDVNWALAWIRAICTMLSIA